MTDKSLRFLKTLGITITLAVPLSVMQAYGGAEAEGGEAEGGEALAICDELGLTEDQCAAEFPECF